VKARLSDECYQRSLDLLRNSAGPAGFVASPAFDHYAAVWTRDAAVACLAAYRAHDSDLVAAAARTLETLAECQGPLGQVPDAVWPERAYWDWGEAGAVDASAWFIIIAAEHFAATGDTEFARRLWPHANRAMIWLTHLDTTNTRLIDSPPAGDWMDSSLVRSGRVFHVNVLYHWAARSLSTLASGVSEASPVDAADLAWRINILFWPEPAARYEDLLAHVAYPPGKDPTFGHDALPAALAAAAVGGRHHYLSHVMQAALVDRCDVLANLLAILSGLASNRRAERILDFLDAVGVAAPFPSKSWPEPVTADDDPWAMWNRAAEAAIPARWRNPPHHYHNAAVWPYIGGFHIAALAATGRRQKASELLERLAAANRVGDWSFHEWLHGETGDPGGAPAQTWNAGSFVLASHYAREGPRFAIDQA
jgi:hypothetical protein